jgi:SH3 domain protein
MKIPFILLLAVIVSMVAPLILAASQTVHLPSPQSATYVSDALEIPLRTGASERYKVIGSVHSCYPITVLKVDATKGYTQIRTPDGVKGWLPSAKLTQTLSSQEQLTSALQELEQLKSRYNNLQQHVDRAVDKRDAEAVSYPQLYEESLRLRQQMAEYRKVSADTVAVDERNKTLQEQAVTLERELRTARQENQTLRNDNNNMRFLTVSIILVICLLMVAAPRLRERKRAQWNRL